MTSLESIFSGKRFLPAKILVLSVFFETLSTYLQIGALNQFSPAFFQNGWEGSYTHDLEGLIPGKWSR